MAESVTLTGEETRVETLVPAELRERVKALRSEGFAMLLDIGGVDYLNRESRFEVVYHFLNIAPRVSTVAEVGTPQRVRLRVSVSAADAVVPSITDLWPSADWAEREIFDLFGVRFDGHPDMRRIQMPTEWKGHPLRKDYPLRGLDADATPLPNFALKSNVPATTPPGGRVAAALEQRLAEARSSKKLGDS